MKRHDVQPVIQVLTEAPPLDRFFQVDNSATRKFGGTGMGLALVQRLVHAHGADVEVESEPGKGTRFSLLWPTRAAAASNEALRVAQERGDRLAAGLARAARASPGGHGRRADRGAVGQP